MLQQFNPKRVLRQISNPLLKEFFERQGHALAVDWDGLSNTQVDDIFDAWQRLPDEQRKAVEITFHDVHEMANEDGTRVIIEESQYHGEDLAPLLEPMESRYDKAIWTFMYRPGVWDAVVRFAKADTFWGGRSWMKRGNMPSAGPKTDAGTLRAFQEAMAPSTSRRASRRSAAMHRRARRHPTSKAPSGRHATVSRASISRCRSSSSPSRTSCPTGL